MAAYLTCEPWTDAGLERLRALWATDASLAEIGQELGRSASGILNRGRRLALPSRPRGRRTDPRPVPTRLPWTDRELNLLIDMREAGASLAEIAEATGHTVSGVQVKASRLGMAKGSGDPTAGRRTCTLCERPFWAASKFVRRCEACHADD